jgi:HEAT repeat protein
MRAQQVAVAVLNDRNAPIEVRRRALEAISNSSHEIVEAAINEAYLGSDQKMRVGALYAMGRSCDNERWSSYVLQEMQSVDPEMRFEAVRAAGELEIAEAIPVLARLVDGNDREIKEIAIWSLGEIGGKKALKILTRLADEAEAEDTEDLLSVIEDAIGNASLVDGEMFF